MVLELREMILSIAPWATESFVWDAISYHNEKAGGPVKGNICQIIIRKNKLRLDFIHGVWLPDPDHLLRGNLKSKRFLPIQHLNASLRSKIKKLLQAATDFNAKEALRNNN